MTRSQFPNVHRRPASRAGRWALLSRVPSTTWLAAAVLVLIIAACVLIPLLSPRDAYRHDLRSTLQGPSSSALLGTDQFGRDSFTRLFVAGRLTFLIGASSTLIGTLLGVLLGTLGGFFGGWVETLTMRTVDLLLALPGLLLGLTLVAALGFGVESVIIATGIASTPVVARISHGATLQVVRRDYIEAARGLGVPDYRLLYRHILPNIATAVVSIATIRWGKNILLAAALNFFGVGVQPPAAEWGLMIAEARTFLSIKPGMVFFPAVMIVTVALALNAIGDGIASAGRGTQGRYLR